MNGDRLKTVPEAAEVERRHNIGIATAHDLEMEEIPVLGRTSTR